MIFDNGDENLQILWSHSITNLLNQLFSDMWVEEMNTNNIVSCVKLLK